MCFSATASFVAGALLIPAGCYTIDRARRRDPAYLPIASFPLLFGIQQIIEGTLWLAIGGTPGVEVTTAALGFLAFAYFLWPFLVPLAAATVEPRPARRRVFIGLTVMGFAFGASLYLPLLINADWLEVSVLHDSILYEPRLVYDSFAPRSAVRLAYALIVAIPLLLSSITGVRVFGALILISVVGSALAFGYAFVSVWCFFAALLSLCVIAIVRGIPQRTMLNAC